MRRETTQNGARRWAILLCCLAITAGNPASLAADEPEVREVLLAPLAFTAPAPLTIVYNVEKPLKVNARSPKTVWVGNRKLKARPGGAPFETIVESGDIQKGSVRVGADYYVCEDHPDAVCWLRRVRFVVPVAEHGEKIKTLQLHTPEFSSPGQN